MIGQKILLIYLTIYLMTGKRFLQKFYNEKKTSHKSLIPVH